MNSHLSDPHEKASFSALAATLTRRGLPADYARRAAAEIADHHRDLLDELSAAGMSPSQALTEAAHRLGDSRTLVKRTVSAYQRRYWCGRWPLFTFLLGPIPILFLSYVAIVLALYIVLTPMEKLGLYRPTLPDGIITTSEWLANFAWVTLICFVAPAVTMVLLAWLAKRAALDLKWLVVSACLLGLTAGALRCGFREARLHPTTLDGRPVLADQAMVTIGPPFLAPSWQAAWKWYTGDLLQICQTLLPFVFVAALVLRAKLLSSRTQQLVAGGS